MHSRIWSLCALTGGAALIALALLADRFGIGKPGFGERQTLLFALGVVLVLGAASLGWARRGKAVGPSQASAGEGAFQRLRRAYLTAAVLVLNTLLLLMVVNGALWLGFKVTDKAGWTVPEPGSEGIFGALAVLRVARIVAFRWTPEKNSPLRLDDSDLASIYPGWSRDEVTRLIHESRRRKLAYQPFSQFGEAPYAGRYVNVSEHGFRRSSNQGPWPMSESSVNVWMFGGSTTFGYGLPDAETIPSFVQQALARELPDSTVAVYNFGQGYFYSSQELALFYALLISAESLPDIVVFVDGVNESMKEPFYSEALRTMVRTPYQAPYARVRPVPLAEGEQVVARYMKNKRLIESWCAVHGIQPLFVWQPSPAWKYDLRFHLFPSEDFGGVDVDGAILGQSPHYAAMERTVELNGLASVREFLTLADLQIGRQQALYVDHVHYTAELSREIGESIGARVVEMVER